MNHCCRGRLCQTAHTECDQSAVYGKNRAVISADPLTHQDTDHVGAVEVDSDGLFKSATLYLSEIENRYLTGEKRRKVIFGLYKLPMVKTDNKRVLLKDGQLLNFNGIKVECILVPGHTWGHMVYLIDDEYLFTGDTTQRPRR